MYGLIRLQAIVMRKLLVVAVSAWRERGAENSMSMLSSVFSRARPANSRISSFPKRKSARR